MAHNIGQMFYCGEEPWHGLGTHLKQPATLDEAMVAGGLDWTVQLAPLALWDEEQSGAPQRMAVVRGDVKPGQKGRVIGVVHPKFKLLQNQDAGRLFDDLFGKGQRVYHTGGYLKHGEVIWLLARLPAGFKVAGDDEVKTYLLFSNSHDGSRPIDIRLTTVRVVCNNTLSMALASNNVGQVFRRAHNGSYEVVKAAAEAFFQSVLTQQHDVAGAMNRLSQAKCDDDRFKDFLVKLLPVPAMPESAPRNLSVRRGHESRIETVLTKRMEIMGVHLNGIEAVEKSAIQIPPASKTWWGGLNSITAWVDHAATVKGNRYANTMFGDGDRLKTTAYRRILEEVGS